MYKLSTIFFFALLLVVYIGDDIYNTSNSNIVEVNEICNISGRGKYLVVNFDSTEHCSSAIIRERRGSEHLLSYNLEYFKANRWIQFFHGEQRDVGRVVYFTPVDSKKIRVHFVRAVKMPSIEQFSIYRTSKHDILKTNE